MPLLGVCEIGCESLGGAWTRIRHGRQRGATFQGPTVPVTARDDIAGVLQGENAAAGVDGRTVLADARARRERALAYRAAVHAVYAKAGLDVGSRSSQPWRTKATVWTRPPVWN